jgi:cytochrome c5
MKHLNHIVVLVMIAALMAATGASAKATKVHASQRQAQHSLVKQAQKSPAGKTLRHVFRRTGRASF